MKEKNKKQENKEERAKLGNKKQQGITLIALIVTIVVLLILAGITINSVLGDNGIFKTAREAANAWNEATINEQEEIQNLINELNNIMNEDGGTGGGETPVVPPEWDLSKVTPVPSEDEEPVNVPVPKGFTASEVEGEKTVDGGFVIKQDGTNNEFVWIPVDSGSLAKMYTEEADTALSTFEGVNVTTDVYSNLRKADGSGAKEGDKPGSTARREPDILTDTTYGDAVSSNSERGIEQIKSVFGFSGTEGEVLNSFANMLVTDYEANYASIKKYGGFYIGRYEITGEITSPTVAKEETVIVSQNWYNLYKACSSIVNTASAKSTMIQGTQWDRVLEWLVETGMESSKVYNDSSKWGNYTNYNTANGYTEGTPGYVAGAGTKVFPAGSSKNWKANNIYDLAGNARDWTQEAHDTDIRVSRGGSYGISGSRSPASSRVGGYPYGSNTNVSARPALYVGL